MCIILSHCVRLYSTSQCFLSIITRQFCVMKVHIGKKIKEVVQQSDMTVTEFAKKINYSRRNIYSIFSKQSIDTGMLKKIGDVLEHDFFADYAGTGTKDIPGMHVMAEPQPGYGAVRIEELEKEIKYLKEINDLLKAQVEKLSVKKGKKR